MRTLSLVTPYGDRYYVHANGDIERADQPGSVSGQWRMLGMVRAGPGFAYGTGFVPLARVLTDLETFEWTYKNGTPRYTVRDFDHGSTRVWGNVKYHGIARITRYRERAHA